MTRGYIRSAEMTLSYRKFKKQVGNNFSYDTLELLGVLQEMLTEKEQTEEYEECAVILQAMHEIAQRGEVQK